MTLEEILALAQTYPHEMTEAEQREQAISFVFGNLRLSNPQITREEVARTYDALKAAGQLKYI